MTLVRTADGFSSADVEGMGLDPQSQDPAGYQTPRDLGIQPDTDGQDPATPGGPAPYNGAEPTGKPVTTDPMWMSPDEPPKPPYSPTPYLGPGPNVDVNTLHNARRRPVEETMTVDLWVEASHDVAQELDHERLVRAKVATSAIWPFLSAARTEREFGHRMALCEEELEQLFPEDDFRTRVTASLRQDFLLVKEADYEVVDYGTREISADPITATAQGVDWIRHEALAEPDVPDGGKTGTPGNPAYFSNGPEAGPNTGSDGQFAQMAPDPWNPMNEQYPMQPSQWVVPPDKAWVDRPMQFGKTSAAGYVGEGVQTGPGQNPSYFDDTAGVAGTANQGGFPADVTLPEPDERVDAYGGVPPMQSGGSSGGDVPYSNSGKQASRWVVADKDNHGACAHCNTPVYREGDTWKHLGGNPGHGVRLHEDHPWIAAQQANRVMASRQMEATYKRTAEASSSDTGGTPPSQADTGSAPAPPPSMEPGGPGAEAGQPLTIPNQGANTNPFATGGGGPEQAGPEPGGSSFTASRYVVADTMNRPTAENPLGVDSGDEFDLNNWEAPAQQRPRQNADARGINTPQRPGRPIPVRSSDGGPGEEEEERE